MPTTSHTPPGTIHAYSELPSSGSYNCQGKGHSHQCHLLLRNNILCNTILSHQQSHIRNMQGQKLRLMNLVTSTEKYARSRTPDFEVGMSTSQTTELQVAFNKRSSNELDLFQYEERVQQNIQKQKSNGGVCKTAHICCLTGNNCRRQISL